MFGNLQGWLVSAVIAVATVGLIVWKGTPEGRSSPTKQLPEAFASVDLKPNPRLLFPPGTSAGNAGDLYRAAAAHLHANEGLYHAFDTAIDLKSKNEAARTLEPAMELLTQASACATMDLFASRPNEVVNYTNPKPVLPELQQLGRVAVNIGAMYVSAKIKNDAKEAKGERYLLAAFHLGRNLCEERVVFEEFRIGSEVLANAATQISKLTERDPGKQAQLIALAANADVGKRYTKLWRVISGIAEEGKMLPMPGDLFDIAQNGTEPMWRTEALLKVGRMRYMSSVSYGDQRAANQILAEVAGQNNLPANVKAAAVAGRDLTVENFRRFGG